MIKDYDFIPQYHLGKVNIVADALSRKTRSYEKVRKAIRKRNTKLVPIRYTCWGDFCKLVDFNFVKNKHEYGFIRKNLLKNLGSSVS